MSIGVVTRGVPSGVMRSGPQTSVLGLAELTHISRSADPIEAERLSDVSCGCGSGEAVQPESESEAAVTNESNPAIFEVLVMFMLSSASRMKRDT